MLVFYVRFLQHEATKDPQQGFTLIELLIVVIIIGILAAVALPSLLSQATRTREAAAQSYVGAVNRAQQAYRLENTSFANNLDNLNFQLPTEKEYNFAFGTVNSTLAEFKAAPKNGDVRAFTGCARAEVTGNSATTRATINEAPAGGTAPATPPSC